MTLDQLDAAVALTGHERFRWLTGESNPDAAQREAYRGLVVRLSSGEFVFAEAAERPPIPMRHGNTCWFKYRDAACGCTGSKCFLLAKLVTIYDCAGCEWSAPIRPEP